MIILVLCLQSWKYNFKEIVVDVSLEIDMLAVALR